MDKKTMENFKAYFWDILKVIPVALVLYICGLTIFLWNKDSAMIIGEPKGFMMFLLLYFMTGFVLSFLLLVIMLCAKYIVGLKIIGYGVRKCCKSMFLVGIILFFRLAITDNSDLNLYRHMQLITDDVISGLIVMGIYDLFDVRK